MSDLEDYLTAVRSMAYVEGYLAGATHIPVVAMEKLVKRLADGQEALRRISRRRRERQP